MIARLIVIFAALTLALIFLRWFSRTPPRQVALVLRRGLLWLAVAAIVFLAATGRLPWLFGLIASLAPFARRLLPLLRHLPLLHRLLARYRDGPGAARPGGGAGQDDGAMSPDEARQILGLGPEAGREEIIAAHRRLMQRLHPDRGGSTYLATRINQAKAVLLEERGG